jgi:hypothetical protein
VNYHHRPETEAVSRALSPINSSHFPSSPTKYAEEIIQKLSQFRFSWKISVSIPAVFRRTN